MGRSRLIHELHRRRTFRTEHAGLRKPRMAGGVVGFLTRMKRRKLVQWALAYLAFSFALLQGVDIVGQQFDWPPALQRGFTLVLAVGVFVTLVLAWYHGERGEQSVRGTELLVLALLLALGGGLLWRFGHAPAAQVSTDTATREGAERGAIGEARKLPGKSIAVLPFANGDRSQQYFSDGLTENLIIALSQFGELKVISRHSAFQLRDTTDSSSVIGDKLGVAHLLEGSVRRHGDTVRISAQLVKAADGTVVWSQQYDRPYQDLFALQDAITQAVADSLQAKLLITPGAVLQSDRPPNGSLAAYAAYQRGSAFTARSTEDSLRKAISEYHEAIRLDPGYAAAYAWLSRNWTVLAAAYLGGSAQHDGFAKARAAAETALALDSGLAVAHVVHGSLLRLADFDWRGAQVEASRALQLAPRDAYVMFSLGVLDATLGNSERAVGLVRQALNADPLHANWYSWLSQYLAGLGRLDEAEAAILQAIALQPAADRFHEQLAVVAILRGDHEAALVAAKQEKDEVWRRIALALALQNSPDRQAADAALRTLVANDGDQAAYQIAEAYALRSEPDRMFEWLDRAWANRDPGMHRLLSDPFILRYREDPRFAVFCRRIGLPATTDAMAMK